MVTLETPLQITCDLQEFLPILKNSFDEFFGSQSFLMIVAYCYDNVFFQSINIELFSHYLGFRPHPMIELMSSLNC